MIQEGEPSQKMLVIPSTGAWVSFAQIFQPSRMHYLKVFIIKLNSLKICNLSTSEFTKLLLPFYILSKIMYARLVSYFLYETQTGLRTQSLLETDGHC
jgi:hypothetical protein